MRGRDTGRRGERETARLWHENVNEDFEHVDAPCLGTHAVSICHLSWRWLGRNEQQHALLSTLKSLNIYRDNPPSPPFLNTRTVSYHLGALFHTHPSETIFHNLPLILNRSHDPMHRCHPRYRKSSRPRDSRAFSLLGECRSRRLTSHLRSAVRSHCCVLCEALGKQSGLIDTTQGRGKSPYRSTWYICISPRYFIIISSHSGLGDQSKFAVR